MDKNSEPYAGVTNELIMAKLARYRPPVAELAAQAIVLSERLPEATVAEALEGVVRDICRESGGGA